MRWRHRKYSTPQPEIYKLTVTTNWGETWGEPYDAVRPFIAEGDGLRLSGDRAVHKGDVLVVTVRHEAKP